MEVVLEHTDVFNRTNDALYDDTVSYLLSQGGSRSSKTYSIIQCLILYALCVYPDTPGNKIITVVRKTLPTLKRTAMRDFIKIMRNLGIYDRNRHNKTDHVYTFPSGSIVQFISADDEEKLMGLESDIVWINEATEIYSDDFMQLEMRCTGKILVDFNPKKNVDWIMSLLDRADVRVIKSTYKDNPFLGQKQIDRIEFLKHTDPGKYLIYAKGEFAQTSEHVFTHWQIAERPKDLNRVIYAMDFGVNNPTVLLRCWHDGSGRRFHFEEVAWLTVEQATSVNILKTLKDVGITKELIVCDHDSRMTMEMRLAGFNTKNAYKDVELGLDVMHTSIITLDPKGTNMIQNFKDYRYKKKNGKLTDEVVKEDDHACDAARYAAVHVRKYGKPMEIMSYNF